MITKFNLFENYNIKDFDIGDYVVIKLKEDSIYYKKIEKIHFMESNIAEVDKIGINHIGVKFDKEFDGDFYFYVNVNEIEFISKYKKTAELYLAAKKYNI